MVTIDRLSRITASILLLLVVQTACSTRGSAIELYLVRGSDTAKLDANAFAEKAPTFILNPRNVRQVKLVQHDDDWFSMEVQVSKDAAGSLSKITTRNVGERLAVVSGPRVLASPRIMEPLHGDRIVFELVSIEADEAKAIAEQLSSSFEFSDQRTFRSKEQTTELSKACEHKNRGEFDQTVDVLERLAADAVKPATKVSFYNKLALCYRLKNDRAKAAEAYRKVIGESTSVDLGNYMSIARAYFYLSHFARSIGDEDKSEEYLEKAISTLEYVTQRFPLTRSAEEASFTIGSYELVRGQTEAARRRASMAKGGEFERQAALLIGLSYEYEKKYKAARDEYELLRKEFPNTQEAGIAEDFIRNLENKKANIAELVDILLQM